MCTRVTDAKFICHLRRDICGIAGIIAGIGMLIMPQLNGIPSGSRLKVGEAPAANPQDGIAPSVPINAPHALRPDDAKGGGFFRGHGSSSAPKRGNELQRPEGRFVHVTGRILNIEGRPVRGVIIRVSAVARAKEGDLSAWIETLQRGRIYAANVLLERIRPIDTGWPQLTTKTDIEGRFVLPELDAERIVTLTAQGSTIATVNLTVVTRRLEPLTVIPNKIYGADFVAKLPPSGTISGIVCAAEDRLPLPDVTVRTVVPACYAWQVTNDARTTTDARGRFRLQGLPANWRGDLLVCPNAGQPYFKKLVDVGDAQPTPNENRSASMDIALRRGIWIEGKISEMATGLALSGVPLRYAPFKENPFARGLPGFLAQRGNPVLTDINRSSDGQDQALTNADGRYRLVGLPGRGIVTVNLADKPFIQDGFSGFDAGGDVRFYPASALAFTLIPPTNLFLDPIREIDPPADASSFHVDFEFARGAKVRLRLIDTGCQPVAGASACYLLFRNRVANRPMGDRAITARCLLPRSAGPRA